MENKMEQTTCVIIGEKEPGPYLKAAMSIFERGVNEVTIKTRGKHIKKAVDEGRRESPSKNR